MDDTDFFNLGRLSGQNLIAKVLKIPYFNEHENVYYVDNNRVFVAFSTYFMHFLSICYEVASKEEKQELDPKNLINALYSAHQRNSIENNWWHDKHIENFETTLKESYVFIYDGEKCIILFLYRLIKESEKHKGKREFVGGFLHILSKHFNKFNKYFPKFSEQSDFHWENTIFQIIDILISENWQLDKPSNRPSEKPGFKVVKIYLNEKNKPYSFKCALVELAEKDFKYFSINSFHRAK